jgi:hypothetical protein
MLILGKLFHCKKLEGLVELQIVRTDDATISIPLLGFSFKPLFAGV